MNGYELQAKSYEQYLSKNPDDPNKEHIKKEIKVNRLLAELKAEDFFLLFDTGAFNDILKGYCRKAMQESGIDREKQNEVIENLRWLLDTQGSEQIVNA